MHGNNVLDAVAAAAVDDDGDDDDNYDDNDTDAVILHWTKQSTLLSL